MERLSSLGKMAATLAHQIRTPLSAAMLYAANLGNVNLQPMARKRFQEKLMSRLEALEAQISDILMFARSKEQTVSEIDAGQLVDQTAGNVTAVVSRGNASLETVSDTGYMPILGNATALVGALSNLIANAVEAGADRIMLRLSKDEEKRCVTFSVANNGPVIPEDIKSKIFEPFFTSKPSGTGLGLAVVSAVTKVHQGILNLESWGDDYPTVFSVTIPLYEESAVQGLSLKNTVYSLKKTVYEREAEKEKEVSDTENTKAAESNDYDAVSVERDSSVSQDEADSAGDDASSSDDPAVLMSGTVIHSEEKVQDLSADSFDSSSLITDDGTEPALRLSTFERSLQSAQSSSVNDNSSSEEDTLPQLHAFREQTSFLREHRNKADRSGAVSSEQTDSESKGKKGSIGRANAVLAAAARASAGKS